MSSTTQCSDFKCSCFNCRGLESFKVARYEITLEAIETLLLPPYKGSTFRGAFGTAFKAIACSERQHRPIDAECDVCLLKDTCPYSIIFESSPPEGSQALRNLRRVPHPFVIEPPLTTQQEFTPGQQMVLGLVLVGKAIPYLPYFLVTMREMGERGIGKGRRRFKVVGAASGGKTIYSGDEGRVYNHDVTVTYPDIQRRAGLSVADRQCAGLGAGQRQRAGLNAVGQRQLTVAFDTMTRLKYQDDLVSTPEFHILIRALARRISSLLYFHHGLAMEMDYKAAFDAAMGVRLVEDRTSWVDWERYSSRQDSKMKLGGLVGEATYEGEFEPFLPWLLLGEYIHVGKGATFGLGKLRLCHVGAVSRPASY